jgi:hypothetical protein
MDKASDEKIEQPFAAKDYVVLLPALASAMALSYDVGCFGPYGVRFMGFFSLTEHLVFALEALPIALVVGTMVPLIVNAIVDTTVVRLPSRRAVVKRVLLSLVVSAVVGISLALGLWTLGIIVFAAFLSLIIKSLPAPVSRVSLACCVAAIALLLSLAVGVDSANLQKFVSKRTQTITTTSAELERILLRSGEKGILVFDRASQTTDFLPWDQIQQISAKANGRPWIYR